MYLLALLFGFSCLGEGVSRLTTKSDLILGFGDTSQMSLSIKRLERVEAEETVY